MKVLITGCCGFIGFHYTRNLLKKKIDVISLTNWSHVLNVASRKKILKNDEIKIIKSFLEKMKVKS